MYETYTGCDETLKKNQFRDCMITPTLQHFASIQNLSTSSETTLAKSSPHGYFYSTSHLRVQLIQNMISVELDKKANF